MTSADKGFFLSYLGDPLSKTAHSGHGMEKESDKPRISSRIDWNTHRPDNRERYALAGSVGVLTGTGISLLWGKLSDKPDIRRDLFMMLAGGVGGVAGEAVRGFRRHTTEHHAHDKKAAQSVTMDDARKLHAKAEAIKELIAQELRVQEAHKRLALATGGSDSSPEVNKTPGSSIWDKIDAARNGIRDKIDAAKNEISGQIKRPDPFGIPHQIIEGMSSPPVVGGAAGAVTGGGLSAIYGKLADNPSIRRDLVMTILGGAAGVGAGFQALALRHGRKADKKLPWDKS